MRAKTSTAFASVLICAAAALSAPADAACKKFGFTVNDYGKDGPTNDAKNLLDKHVAEWAAKNGVGEYSTGKKTVSCELFLDVILFDEHTCTASATVCWGPDAKKFGTQSAATPGAAPAAESSGSAPPAPVRKADALGHEAGAQAAATAPAAEAAAPEAPPASDTAQMDAAPTEPVEQIAAPTETPAAPAVHAVAASPAAPAAEAPAAATVGGVVETGALQAGQALPHASSQPVSKASGPSEKERAAAAAAAASAAAAAERAAIAAETAANAAKEAAAAAVAASAASKGAASVPPLDHASGAKPVHAE